MIKTPMMVIMTVKLENLYGNAIVIWYDNLWSLLGTFYGYELTWIPTGMRNYLHYEMWGEITYPDPNFTGCTVEVWEGKRDN